MDNYKIAACEHIKADPGRVIVCRIQGDNLVLVVNNGKLGCPKYVIPLAELEQKPEAGPEPEQRATPSAIELAEKFGVNLALVPGTGKDGRITRDDVRAAMREH